MEQAIERLRQQNKVVKNYAKVVVQPINLCIVISMFFFPFLFELKFKILKV